MDIQQICIAGSGTMGAGIAQVAAQSGFHTILYDVNAQSIEKANTSITQSLTKLASKGIITPQQSQDTHSRLRFTTNMNDCIADVFIEAIVEKEDIKAALFNQLNEMNHSEVIFASNTSSLSISSLAKKIMQPQRVAGMHFFNPAPMMKLVEVVEGEQTSPHVVNTLVQLAKQFGKTPVVCKDAPGFIVNHVARPYYLEALQLVEEGNADFETIDALTEAAGFRMGPFRLMDLIGNDINLAVSEQVFEAMGRPARLMPSALQKERVRKGELGRKSGTGYYKYQP